MQQTTYQGNYLTVTEENINGHIYERVSLRSGVHIVPVDGTKVLLMKEHRIHEGSWRWKLVSGWCDKEGKSPLEIAQEELAEEIGMQARSWAEVARIDNPGATINDTTHYFVCEGVSPLEIAIVNPDDSEVLGFQWFELPELWNLVERGELWIDRSFAVVLWQLHLRGACD